MYYRTQMVDTTPASLRFVQLADLDLEAVGGVAARWGYFDHVVAGLG